MGAGERPGFEAAQMGASPHLASNEPGVLQGLDVFGGGSERDREGLRKLPNRPLAAGEVAQHPAPRGVAERVKDGIEPGCF